MWRVLLLVLILVVAFIIYMMLRNQMPITGGNREIEYRFDKIDIPKIKNILSKTSKAKQILPETLMPLVVYKKQEDMPTRNISAKIDKSAAKFQIDDQQYTVNLHETKGARKQLDKILETLSPEFQHRVYIRVRHEGDMITFTTKYRLSKEEFPIENEIELTPNIKNMETMDRILKSAGLQVRYKVEKLRERWSAPGIKEIVFDSYPGTPTFMEIDAHSQKSLQMMVRKLGLDPDDRFQVQDHYNYFYGAPTDRPMGGELTFENAFEKMSPYIDESKHEKFKRILIEQNERIK